MKQIIKAFGINPGFAYLLREVLEVWELDSNIPTFLWLAELTFKLRSIKKGGKFFKSAINTCGTRISTFNTVFNIDNDNFFFFEKSQDFIITCFLFGTLLTCLFLF